MSPPTRHGTGAAARAGRSSWPMALCAAAEDCDGAAPGAGRAGGRGAAAARRQPPRRVPAGLAHANPALQVAARLGFAEGDEPRRAHADVAIGGNTPQALMHDACRAISRGELDVVLVTGAEAMYTRALRGVTRRRRRWHGPSQPAEARADPVTFGVDKPGRPTSR